MQLLGSLCLLVLFLESLAVAPKPEGARNGGLRVVRFPHGAVPEPSVVDRNAFLTMRDSALL